MFRVATVICVREHQLLVDASCEILAAARHVVSAHLPRRGYRPAPVGLRSRYRDAGARVPLRADGSSECRNFVLCVRPSFSFTGLKRSYGPPSL